MHSSYRKALMLSLGHNSSAIFTDGCKVIGYEQERLDRIKSSSAAPIKALDEIEKHTGKQEKLPMYITHWFDQLSELPVSKYTAFLKEYAEHNGHQIITHDSEFTHHDAHAWSGLSFYKHYYRETIDSLPENQVKEIAEKETHCLVVDGFGNNQEVLSFYRVTTDNSGLKLRQRVYGYENSLGLMYQYATKFCGMKMNQDEYKFLGYESKIASCFNSSHIKKIVSEAEYLSDKLCRVFNQHSIKPPVKNTLIDYDTLSKVDEDWHKLFEKLLAMVNVNNPTSDLARVIIGFFIQEVIECTLVNFIKGLNIHNLIVAGGVFYNVKLNNKLLKSIDGLFSVVPVAGDQGASIGFYERFNSHFNWDTLCIGNREIDFDVLNPVIQAVPGISLVEDEETLVAMLSTYISRGEICNLITDKMEYGPRALGSTSSLFSSTVTRSAFNNKLNRRNEVMPFAPMLPSEALSTTFDDSFRRVVGSDRFMTITYDYLEKPSALTEGVYHKYPLEEAYSGRPQSIHYKSNPMLHKVLTNLWNARKIPMITNTSYNYHGEPIVFSMGDVINTHIKQLENMRFMLDSADTTPKVNLIIYKSKESD